MIISRAFFCARKRSRSLSFRACSASCTSIASCCRLRAFSRFSRSASKNRARGCNAVAGDSALL